MIIPLIHQLKSRLRASLVPKVKSPFRLSRKERWRVKLTPRSETGWCIISGRRFVFTDSYWFQHQCEEILFDEIYRFKAESVAPNIIDCGANVGLSVLYFRMLHPRATITAFEADPKIFSILQDNVREHGLEGVVLHQKAVWVKSGNINFHTDGSVGGHLLDSVDDGEPDGKRVSIEGIRLRDILDQSVDFLKMDIEGSEMSVLRDCADRLHNVKKLFVEYHSKPGQEQELPALLVILQDAGFRYYIKEAGSTKHPFMMDQNANYFDLQLNVSAYRVS